MKHVRTARGYQALVVPKGADSKEKVTVTGTAQEVSNELAEDIEKHAELAGVEVIVTDDAPAAGDAPALATSTPDLSAGVSAVSGTGDPVTTPDTTTTKKKAGN